MTRVLVVSHACVIDENQRLLVHLDGDADLEVGLIAPSRWNTDLRGPQPFRRLPGYDGPVYALRPVLSGQGTLHFYPGAVRVLRRFRPDIVHLDEEPWSLVAWHVAEAAAHLGARVLFHTKENLHKWYPWPFRLIERRVFSLAACGFAMTREAEDVLQAKGFAKRIFTLPHAIEADQFRPMDATDLRRAVGLDGTVIAYFGRLSAEKGILDLVHALERLAASGRAAGLGALVIGSGPLDQEVRRRLVPLALGGGARVLASLPHGEVARYYNAADVVVVPSRTIPRWKEQFGRVIIEALASGCAVIGSDSGEIPHLIRETEGGLVFPEGDTTSLAEAIHALASDPEARHRYARRGRDVVLAHYTYPTVAARVREVYRWLEEVRCAAR